MWNCFNKMHPHAVIGGAIPHTLYARVLWQLPQTRTHGVIYGAFCAPAVLLAGVPFTMQALDLGRC